MRRTASLLSVNADLTEACPFKNENIGMHRKSCLLFKMTKFFFSLNNQLSQWVGIIFHLREHVAVCRSAAVPACGQ